MEIVCGSLSARRTVNDDDVCAHKHVAAELMRTFPPLLIFLINHNDWTECESSWKFMWFIRLHYAIMCRACCRKQKQLLWCERKNHFPRYRVWKVFSENCLIFNIQLASMCPYHPICVCVCVEVFNWKTFSHPATCEKAPWRDIKNILP